MEDENEFKVARKRKNNDLNKLLIKAKDDPNAQFQLGAKYYNGKDVEQNYEEAIKWFTVSANAGNEKAQYNLAVMYENGEGVKENLEEAIKWYKKSAKQGNEDAKEALKDLGIEEKEEKPIVSNENKKKENIFRPPEDSDGSIERYKQAAEQGDEKAQKALKNLKEYTQEVLRSIRSTNKEPQMQEVFSEKIEKKENEKEKAVSLYEKGLKYYSQAQPDYYFAFQYFMKSAKLGYALAQYNLANMYEYGTYVDENIDEAIKWYKKAAEQGDEKAQKALKELGIEEIEEKPIVSNENNKQETIPQDTDNKENEKAEKQNISNKSKKEKSSYKIDINKNEYSCPKCKSKNIEKCSTLYDLYKNDPDKINLIEKVRPPKTPTELVAEKLLINKGEGKNKTETTKKFAKQFAFFEHGDNNENNLNGFGFLTVLFFSILAFFGMANILNILFAYSILFIIALLITINYTNPSFSKQISLYFKQIRENFIDLYCKNHNANVNLAIKEAKKKIFWQTLSIFFIIAGITTLITFFLNNKDITILKIISPIFIIGFLAILPYFYLKEYVIPSLVRLFILKEYEYEVQYKEWEEKYYYCKDCENILIIEPEANKVITNNIDEEITLTSRILKSLWNLEFIDAEVIETSQTTSIEISNIPIPVLHEEFDIFLTNSIDIPNIINGDKNYQITSIGSWVFTQKRLKKNAVLETELPVQLKTQNLIKITIPESVKIIKDTAFAYCTSIETIIMPEGVKTIGSGAFWNCRNLKSIRKPNSISNFGEIVIPNSVEKIGESAFEYCTSINSIIIPDTVKEIGENAFKGVQNIYYNGKAEGAPWGALKMNDIIEEKQKTNDNKNIIVSFLVLVMIFLVFCFFSTIKEQNTHKTHKTSTVTTTSNNYTNTETPKVVPQPIQTPKPTIKYTEVVLDKQVLYQLGYNPADKKNFTSVKIPATYEFKGNHYKITKIGEKAFYNYGALQKVTIEEGVQILGVSAFENCTALTTVNLPSNINKINNNVFANCKALKKINLPNGITEIRDNLFYNCISLSEINIPNSVKEIKDMAFYKCKSLKKISLPENLTYIGISAFAGCRGLESVNIPNSCMIINKWAFSNCVSLSYVTIPDEVISIGEEAFCNVPYVYYDGSASGQPWGALDSNKMPEIYINGTFLNGNKNFILATMHMGYEFYLVQDSIKVSPQSNEYELFVEAKIIVVETETKEKKDTIYNQYKYDLLANKMYLLNNYGVYEYVPKTGSFAETGIRLPAGNLIFQILKGRKFYETDY